MVTFGLRRRKAWLPARPTPDSSKHLTLDGRDGLSGAPPLRLRGRVLLAALMGLTVLAWPEPGPLLAQSTATTSVSVPDGAEVFPGRDGAWILLKSTSLPSVSLILPDASVVHFASTFSAEPVAIADFPEGPRLIFEDKTTQRLDLLSPGRTISEAESLDKMAADLLCQPDKDGTSAQTACQEQVEASLSVNLRGEVMLEIAAYSFMRDVRDHSLCLSDDGSLHALTDLANKKWHWDDDLKPTGCRAYPNEAIVIKGFWKLPGSQGGRTNYDLLYAHEPGDSKEYVACLNIGKWQDVDARRSARMDEVDLVLSEGNSVFFHKSQLIYEFLDDDKPNCHEVIVQSNAASLEFETNPKFARYLDLEQTRRNGPSRVLMVYLPDQKEVLLIDVGSELE